jgi:hypothetical protein
MKWLCSDYPILTAIVLSVIVGIGIKVIYFFATSTTDRGGE